MGENLYNKRETRLNDRYRYIKKSAHVRADFLCFTQKKYLISIFSAIKIYTLKKANFHINMVNFNIKQKNNTKIM